jgi:uncharacterized protein YecT (DUF1311 family)
MRKTLLVPVAVTVGVMTSFAMVPARAQSQPELNAAARVDADKADAELTKTYQSLRDSMKDDSKSQELLDAAEKAWLDYRDKEVEYEAQSDFGGSIYLMAEATVSKRLTMERIKYLQGILKNGPDIP